MTDKQFDAFLENTIKSFGEDYIDFSEDEIIQHTFSRSFERKMARLIRHQKSFYFPMIKTPTRRTVTIMVTVIIVLSTMVMSVGATREAFTNFFINIFDTHTKVLSVDDEDAPLDFNDKYEITADMSDFELVDFWEDVFARNYVYENEYGYIWYDQNIKEYYNISVNTEGYDIETVYINGFEAFYVDMRRQNGKIVIWDNGDYVLSILVSCDKDYEFSKDELIELANSVQKVE